MQDKIMAEKRYMTVVFEYEDGAKLPLELTSAFSSDSMVYHDCKITAISLEDEISRAEELENQIN